MTQTEALKLALEALEGVLDDSPKVLEASISGGLYEVVQCRDAITAIKAVLEAKDEPVAWVCHGTHGHHDIDFLEEDVDSLSVGTQLYTTPPQRTWVALTDEEVDQFHNWKDCTWSTNELVRYVEAKLKEKNT